MVERLTMRYPEEVPGALSSFDRVIITGSTPQTDYADPTTSELYTRGPQISDNTDFTAPVRDETRQSDERFAQESYAV